MVTAYLRVSTGRQHLENQEGEIKQYAKSKGITVTHWVRETVSGKTDSKHRSLGRIMRLLKKGDTLIVTELSRLSRSLHDIMLIMKLCAERGVTVLSTKDGCVFDDSLNSKVLSFAFGLAAELEHRLNSQRTREAMALRRAEGFPMGRRRGIGPKMEVLIARRDMIVALLESGVQVIDICREYGVSYDTYRRFRKEYMN